DGAVVDRAAEIGRHGEHAAAELAGNLLIDLVGGGVEFAHRIAIDDIDQRVFAGTDGKVARHSTAIDHVDQQNPATRTEVLVGVGLCNRIVRGEIVREFEAAAR